MDRRETIFWLPSGPKLSWADGVLHIEDLNPEMSIKWVIDASELAQIGRRCLELAKGEK